MRTVFRQLKYLLTAIVLFPLSLFAQQGDLMNEFEQLIPRGRIAAITYPTFVHAGDADIADDSWVLGVVIDENARAYSLNLLNSHEIVNDQVNGKFFAAVW